MCVDSQAVLGACGVSDLEMPHVLTEVTIISSAKPREKPYKLADARGASGFPMAANSGDLSIVMKATEREWIAEHLLDHVRTRDHNRTGIARTR